tara:strand:+ start:554 stop:727 length:174 start_codon:yes stop_codon:yes gene_type:complete
MRQRLEKVKREHQQKMLLQEEKRKKLRLKKMKMELSQAKICSMKCDLDALKQSKFKL